MKRLVFILLGVLAIVLVGGVAIWLWKRSAAPEKAPLSVEQRLELLRVKNEALGHLENDEFVQAEPLLLRIATELPDDPLGHRNLAIALFQPSPLSLKGESELGQEARDKLERLTATIEHLLQIDSRSPATHHLAGRVFEKRAELVLAQNDKAYQQFLDRARTHYRQAADLDPADPASLYDLYLLEKSQSSPEEPPPPAMLDILRGVQARAPDNLAVLLEQVEALVRRQDQQARKVVERILPILPQEPAPGTKEGQVRKVLVELDQLLAQSPDQWAPKGAFKKIGEIREDLRNSALYQQALRQLQLHTLAFMLYDFRPAFYEDLPLEPEAPIQVRFELFQPDGSVEEGGIIALAHEDLLATNTFQTVVLRQRKDGTRLEVLSSPGQATWPPVESPEPFTHLQLADLDLDIIPRGAQAKQKDSPAGAPTEQKDNIPADLDVILYGPRGIRLLENQQQEGKRQWADRTEQADLPALAGLQWLLVADMDHDGNLDLIVGLKKGVRILRNRGNWTLEDISKRSAGLDSLEITAAVYGDFDRDGDLDFILLTEAGKTIFLANQRSGRFNVQEKGNTFAKARCLLTFDANNDGLLDLLVGHSSGTTLYLASEDSVPPQNAAQVLALAAPRARQAGAFDYDNDGRLDLWIRTEDEKQPLRLFRNTEGKGFRNVTELLPAVQGPVHSITPTDVDNDGDLDLLFLGPQGRQGLRNEGGNQNHWLRIRLRAFLVRTDSPGAAARCNYSNVGGILEVKSGRHYQLQQVQGPVTHVGLGQRRQVDVVRSIWTNGVPQAHLRPAVDQILVEDQRLKGSCPFLFTWNGERFVFVTDCLWSSGLGMKLAPDVYLDHRRQYNYLVIRGDQLRPRDGRYVLQFTTELWEAAYLDQAELWVVDHPAGVEIYTNQRVPPDLDEEFRLLLVQQRHTPVAARDHRGRDVLDIIKHRDGNYLGGFRRIRYIGLAEPHWLELDLGNLASGGRQPAGNDPPPEHVTLYLTGWIWPTDTSGNLAIAQDPRFRQPTGVIGGMGPPAVLVPDGKGGWETAVPSMGFPAGKLQTVAVQVPLAKFPSHDYRVRIATTMELYWDEVFFTLDKASGGHKPPDKVVPPASSRPEAGGTHLNKVQVRKLPVVHADLHYRGFSRMTQASPTSPHWFDYDDVDPNPRWLPVRGPYTRYGEVTELLQRPECQYVVMGPGDEVTLEFVSLPPPAPGWERSFIFYANGWLKDFDFNADTGDQIEPLPFDGMSRYPYTPPEQYPQTPELEHFRRTYLTREPDRRLFWDQLKPGRR